MKLAFLFVLRARSGSFTHGVRESKLICACATFAHAVCKGATLRTQNKHEKSSFAHSVKKNNFTFTNIQFFFRLPCKYEIYFHIIYCFFFVISFFILFIDFFGFFLIQHFFFIFFFFIFVRAFSFFVFFFLISSYTESFLSSSSSFFTIYTKFGFIGPISPHSIGFLSHNHILRPHVYMLYYIQLLIEMLHWNYCKVSFNRKNTCFSFNFRTFPH